MLLKLIDDVLVNDVAEAAKNSARQRSSYSMHLSNEDKVQRLVSVLEPNSYVRPHKHENPDKVEIFVILRGKLLVAVFAEDGRVAEHLVLTAGQSPWGVEVPPGAWHMTLALEPATAIYEVVEGPWEEHSHKKYPDWAPAEEDKKAAQEFIARVRQELMLY